MSRERELQKAISEFRKFIKGLLASQPQHVVRTDSDPPVRRPIEGHIDEVIDAFLTIHPKLSRYRKQFRAAYADSEILSLDFDLWKQLGH